MFLKNHDGYNNNDIYEREREMCYEDGKVMGGYGI